MDRKYILQWIVEVREWLKKMSASLDWKNAKRNKEKLPKAKKVTQKVIQCVVTVPVNTTHRQLVY